MSSQPRLAPLTASITTSFSALPHWIVLLCATLICGLFPQASIAEPPYPVGDAFQINTYTPGNQGYSDVAIGAAGDFVVVWESGNGLDGASYGIFGQRYGSDGVAVGGEFQVNSTVADVQIDAAVDLATSGEFVVVWRSWGNDGSEYGVFGQRFDSAGAAAGEEFQVNAWTTGSQEWADVAYDASGNFLVTWESDGQDMSFGGIYARLYGSDGAPLTDEIQIHTTEIDEQNDPAVAALPDGFLVVWESDGIDSSGEAVVMQRLDANAALVGDETRVNTSSSGDQEDPAVAVLDDGSFAVVWESDGQDGSGETVIAQVFDSAGTMVGSEMILNSTVSGNQYNPEVSTDGEGGFVAAWINTISISNDDLHGRRFSAAGETSGSEFVIRSTSGFEAKVSVAGGTQGRFIVSWHAEGGDGDASGVLAQRYNGVTVLEDGFESGDLSVWSSSVP